MKIFGGTIIVAILLLVQPLRAQGQSKLSLGSSFFAQNRDKVRQKLPENSCAVLFSAPYSTFQSQLNPQGLANYVQEPNFYYLTGLNSPKCILILFSEPFKYKEKELTELLFYPDKANFQSQFTGIVPEIKSFASVESIGKWTGFCRDHIARGNFDRVWMMSRDYSGIREPGFLSSDDLLQAFYSALSPGYPVTGKNMIAYRLIKEGQNKGPLFVAAQVNAMLNYYPQLGADPLLEKASRIEEESELGEILEELEKVRLDVFSLRLELEDLRLEKSETEVKLMERTSKVLEISLKRAIRTLELGKREYELAAEMEYSALRSGAQPVLSPLVAAGKNSGLLSYQTGRVAIASGDLVVFDLAARLGSYCARVTRTVPEGFAWKGNQQKEFERLLKAHLAAIATCKPGASAATVLARFDAVLPKSAFPKMMRMRWVTAIGIGLNDLSWPPQMGEKKAELKKNMTLLLESALQGDEYGIVLRDVVLVQTEGGKILTSAIPFRADELKSFAGQ